ncbi:hypothetical protein DFH07DRAFT_1063103 [Mycena maculata]|uniref:Uncharacterized protein n=1 Tax=Mycena maculata TaxID=230809 RepID=A0AAD7N558_9AGAR|nr:hypothetical protein DFH07DRAFT_1063103 [Mycena maculata]
MADGGTAGEVDDTFLLNTFPKAPYVPPPWRKRASSTGVLLLLLIPFAFMLWLASWTNTSPIPEHPASALMSELEVQDVFMLDRTFDLTAPPTTRVHRRNVSAVPIPIPCVRVSWSMAARRACSSEANAHDRISRTHQNGTHPPRPPHHPRPPKLISHKYNADHILALSDVYHTPAATLLQDDLIIRGTLFWCKPELMIFVRPLDCIFEISRGFAFRKSNADPVPRSSNLIAGARQEPAKRQELFALPPSFDYPTLLIL